MRAAMRNHTSRDLGDAPALWGPNCWRYNQLRRSARSARPSPASGRSMQGGVFRAAGVGLGGLLSPKTFYFIDVTPPPPQFYL